MKLAGPLRDFEVTIGRFQIKQNKLNLKSTLVSPKFKFQPKLKTLEPPPLAYENAMT